MTPPERSKRLHNFNLPRLKWGQQRFLRCVKHHHHHQPAPPPPPPPSSSPPPSDSSVPRPTAADQIASSEYGSGGEIGVGQGKLGLDPRFAGKKKASVVGVDGDDTRGGAGNATAVVRLWNLRTRRATCKEPAREELKVVDSPRRHDSVVNKRHNEDRGVYPRVAKEKVKFSVSLLREEIDEDFAAMIGKRPPRRPKKRPKIVQKQLNSLFPGLWLTEEVTADSYSVPEIPET